MWQNNGTTVLSPLHPNITEASIDAISRIRIVNGLYKQNLLNTRSNEAHHLSVFFFCYKFLLSQAHSLWRRANARNVSFLSLTVVIPLSTRLIKSNFPLEVLRLGQLSQEGLHLLTLKKLIPWTDIYTLEKTRFNLLTILWTVIHYYLANSTNQKM